MKNFYTKQQSGFVILFTILISSIILMIGFGIFSIATRETILSSSARDAQAAFYAADAGAECALFAESQGVFSTPSVVDECNGTRIIYDPSNPSPVTFFVIVDNISSRTTCAEVTVVNLPGTGTSPSRRRVISQGYNICDNNGRPDRTNPRLVERVLDTKYVVAQ